MKKLLPTFCTALAILSLSACQSPQVTYDGKSVVPVVGPNAPENISPIEAYLAAHKAGPAEVNLEGVYYSPEWGMVILKQDAKGDLSGVFQDYYHVYGLVSGKKATIALVDDGSVEFTVELTSKGSGTLEGAYSDEIPFVAEGSVPTSLHRLSR